MQGEIMPQSALDMLMDELDAERLAEDAYLANQIEAIEATAERFRVYYEAFYPELRL